MGKVIEIIQKIDFQSNEDTLKYIKEIRNCVLEDLLVSYDFMKSLHPQSLNTIRVPTFLEADGKVKVFHPFLRVCRGESVVDNAGSEGIFANTDAETEIVIMDGVDELGSQYKTHPDTHFQYRGLQIPRWNELLKLEEKLAKVLPTVRFVGFDLALTTKDWVMVEGNNNPQPVLKFNRLEGEVKMNTAILSLIIFGVCVVLFIWNKLPISVTALLGLTAMVLTGVVSFSDGFKNFGSSTIVLICAMMVVGKATFNTGLAQVVGEKVTSMAKGNERLIVILATAMTALISAFLSNIATLAIMISILTGICAGNKHVKFMNVILPVSMAAVIGGAATLVGSTTQLTAQGILEEYLGTGFTFSTFAIPGGLICLILVVYCGFVGYPLGKKLWGKRPEYDETPASERGEELPTPNKPKMIIMGIIFVVTVLMFIFCDQIKKVIPNMNIAMVSIVSCLLCILTGCIDHKNAIKSVNWSLVVWFCSSLGMASGLEKSGGGELLANWFIGLFGPDVSPFMLYVAFLILVVVLTQFLSNSTVLAIILPVVFSITEGLGLNTFSFAVGLTIAGAMAVATPLANTTIGMSMVAKYKFSDYIIYAGPFTLMALAVLLILVPILWSLA